MTSKVFTSRWIKAQTVKMVSERSVRMFSEEMVGKSIAAEEEPLFQPLRLAVDLKLSPMVYIPDLRNLILCRRSFSY